MTFDEIQAVLENMLSVQRGLQESQLKLQKSQLKQQEKLETLLELTKVHEQRFTQFYGYHQAAAGDQSHLEEELIKLRMRVEKLEEQA